MYYIIATSIMLQMNLGITTLSCTILYIIFFHLTDFLKMRFNSAKLFMLSDS